jgi:hypothetical protein
MAIIAMNRLQWEEPNGWQNGFWKENPLTGGGSDWLLSPHSHQLEARLLWELAEQWADFALIKGETFLLPRRDELGNVIAKTPELPRV